VRVWTGPPRHRPRIAADSNDWYTGYFEGYYFGQLVVRRAGDRDQEKLARRWIRTLTAAIRTQDRSHLIGVGLLPIRRGPFAPENVADLLDVLLVHVYPERQKQMLRRRSSRPSPGPVSR